MNAQYFASGKMAQGKSANKNGTRQICECGGNDGFCCVMVSKQGKIYPVVIVNTVHAGCNATLVPGPFTSLPHREQGKKDPGSGW